MSPIELGSFSRETTLPIRSSLSIQDSPQVLRGATDPTAEDLVPTAEEYRLQPGDVVNVFIYGLRAANQESAQQSTVDNQGRINLPVVGWVDAADLTAKELESRLRDLLAKKELIYEAEVLVQIAAQRGLTYTIFGNESLAIRLNRGPGVFPIPRADFRLLDALSVSGGLSELVREVYVFRNVERDKAQAKALVERTESAGASSFNGADQPDAAKITGNEGDVSSGADKHGANQAGESNDATGDGNEPVVPPPPTPSVMMADGFGGATPGALDPELARYFEDRPTKVRANLPTRLEPTRAPLAAGMSQTEDAPPPPDVQQIMDLMLAEHGQTEQPQTQDDSHSEGEETGSAPPSRWVWDAETKQWIEIRTDQAPAPDLKAIAPLAEGGPEPVIDWERISEDYSDRLRIIRIDAEGLRRGDPRYNVVVRAGDVVRLFSGDIGFYYMTGHINGPGVYAFRSGAAITLKNAVAAAGGLDALGWPDRVTVYRRFGDREQMIQVNLDRVFAGLDPDFYLKRDDIVNIGTHPVAPFLLQLRNFTIPQMGGTISYAYRYIRQETFFKNEDLNAPNRPGLFP